MYDFFEILRFLNDIIEIQMIYEDTNPEDKRTNRAKRKSTYQTTPR